MGIRNIQHVALTVPDINSARDFFADFGLETIERGDAVVCRCVGRDQDQLVLIEGHPRRLGYVSFGVGEAELQEMKKALEGRDDVSFADAPAWSDGEGIWFTDFEGMLTNIRAADEAPWRTEPAATFNTPGKRERVGRRSEFLSRAAVEPRRLGHAVLFTTDAARKMDFYTDPLGMRLSDKVANFLNFMYCPTGSDHHVVAFAESWSWGLQHAAFEVDSTDEVGIAGDQMKGKGYVAAWGPGRHGPGSNVFYYIRDPFNWLFEYFADLDYIPEGMEWEAIDWAERDESPHLWGPTESSDFPTNFETPKPR